MNARRVVKIAGISQRATSGARLTSVMMPVSDPSLLIEVLTAVNRDLEFDWDPLTFGSIDGETGSASFDDVGDAARDEFCPFGFQSVSYYRFAADIRALGGDP